MKSIMSGLVILTLSFSTAFAADDKPQLKRLGIGEAAATKALGTTAGRTQQTESLNHLIDSLNQHFIVSFQATRKFDLVARSDLAKLLDEQNLPKGLIVAADGKSLPGAIKGLDYMVVTSVTDFKDQKEGLFIEGLGTRVDRRVVAATVVLKVYNTTTGSLLEAIDVPVSLDEKGAQRVPQQGFGNRAPDDSLLEAVATEISNESALRVLTLLFPVRVIGVTDDQVTLNRGEGTGLVEGQPWEVFAQGKEMVDPDTGASLGREEIKVGEVVIVSVLPKFSKAHIVGENRGIATGAVVRPKPAQFGEPGPGGRGGARDAAGQTGGRERTGVRGEN